MKARIYKPGKTAMQSGRGGRMKAWVLEYEYSSARVPEALMGWNACADTMNQPPLRFNTLEDAQRFADANCIDYTIGQLQKRRIKPRNYGDNFRYIEEEGT